jgi:prevent-host-death family protein
MFIMYKIFTSNIEDLPMDSINSTDAKKSFSDVVLKVQQEPVWITRHDKPVAVVMSAKEYQEIQALKERVLKMELEKGFDSLKAGKVIDGQDAINKLMHTIDNA